MSEQLEYVGDTKFSPCDIKAEATLEDWLSRAREEFAMKGVATAVLNMSDELTDGELQTCLFISEFRAVRFQSLSSLADVGANAPRAWIDVTLPALQSGAHDQAKD